MGGKDWKMGPWKMGLGLSRGSFSTSMIVVNNEKCTSSSLKMIEHEH